MADQDHDGSHIKGLLINFLHHFWPSLLKIDGFLKQFITPIVKCAKGKKEQTFFTIPQYINWKEENSDGKGWKIKYYKGIQIFKYFHDIYDIYDIYDYSYFYYYCNCFYHYYCYNYNISDNFHVNFFFLLIYDSLYYFFTYNSLLFFPQYYHFRFGNINLSRGERIF